LPKFGEAGDEFVAPINMATTIRMAVMKCMVKAVMLVEDKLAGSCVVNLRDK